MQARVATTNIGRYLPHALAATFAVVVLPTIGVYALLGLTQPDPAPWVVSFFAVAVVIAVSAAGSALWMQHPGSAEVSFGELMIWGWIKRKRAEDKVGKTAQLLGLQEDQRDLRFPRLTPQQQLQALHALTAALESKDPYTHGHSRRVERHAYRTALVLGLTVRDIEDLRKAAALHDVGKIRVPQQIIRKPGPLTPEERAVVEQHVSVGAWMVSKVGSRDVVTAVRHHHEHFDGTGYPDGLVGDDIPLFARIIAVADAYDAMVSTRPYRPGLGKHPAVETLKTEAGIQFDPDVVEAFLTTLPKPAVVPVAGLFVFLRGMKQPARDLTLALKRAGAATVAPAVGAVGASLAIGMAVMAPPVTVPDAGSDAPLTLAQPGPIDTSDVRPPAVEQRRTDGIELETRAARPGGPAGEATVSDRRAETDRTAAALAAPAGEAPSTSGGATKSTDRPAGSEPTSEGTPRVKGDPQPDKGRDCDGRGKGKGRGPDLHCR